MASMKNANSNVSRAQLMTAVFPPGARRRAHSAAGRCGAYRSTRRSSSRPATNWEIGTFGLPQLSNEDAVRRYCRALAESRRAGLVEAAAVESWSGPAVMLLCERLEKPAFIFTGMLGIPAGQESWGWNHRGRRTLTRAPRQRRRARSWIAEPP